MSRRRPAVGAFLALMLSTGATLAACGGGNDVGENQDDHGVVPAEEIKPSAEMNTTEPAPRGTVETETRAEAPPTTERPVQAVVVERIIDGDTIEVRGDGDILPEMSSLPVRLLEIDAPEVGSCYSSEATARIAELIPVGSSIRIERDKDLKDPYDRYLLYIWNDQEDFVNESLVRDGYATAVLYEPNDKYWQTISQADDAAEQNGSGLWSACNTEANTPAPPDPPEPTDPATTSPETSLPPGPPAGIPDVDCSDLAGPVQVGPDDPHRLDRDGDGIGCDAN
jgi:endonuclease YncB( thermonuclease family)